MCDTLVVPAGLALRGRTLFAKNSDRERGEAQGLEAVAPQVRPAGVRATFIEAAWDGPSRACLLSRPHNHWGAEIGANDAGVVIGNEATHALGSLPRAPRLTGMDLVRRGLEVGATARSAVAAMTEALERYGQGGDCGYRRPFYYQNGFVAADAREAFVLETKDRSWALVRVEAARALSNAYSIDRPMAASADVDMTEAPLWARWADPQREAAGQGRARRQRAEALLATRRPGPLELMAILRDHGDLPFDPATAPRKSLCMHAGVGLFRSQSVASWVSELGEDGAVHWVTASAAPCLSLFRPLFMDALPADLGGRPEARFDPAVRWWRHERLHRAALADMAHCLDAISPRRDQLEAQFLAAADDVTSASPDRRRRASTAIWREADAAEERWLGELALLKPRFKGPAAFRRGWLREFARSGVPGRSPAGGRTARRPAASTEAGPAPPKMDP